MEIEGSAVAQRVQHLRATTEQLRDLHTLLWQLPPAELGGLLGDLGELIAVATAQAVLAIGEAEKTGVVEASQAASTTAWVTEQAWHLRRQAHTLAKTAAAIRRPGMEQVRAAVIDVDVDPATAVSMAAEFAKLAKDLKPEAFDVVLGQFLAVGAEHGPLGARKLREQLLARYGKDGEFDDEQDTKARQIDFTAGRQAGSGLWNYELTVDNEGRAIIEAAIGQLSAPQPGPDGARDERPAGRRRGEALIEVCRRATAHIAGGQPMTSKSALIVTMSLDDLRNNVGAGTTLGTRAGELLLSPAVVRRLACEARIIPAVLGGNGEILDYGRAERLFTKAQIRYLWLRDRHCSFPDCRTPAAWCHGHHLTSWIDGGLTDIDNAALVCPRHHSVIHRDRLAGRVVDGRVEWDLRPGSYQPTTDPTRAGPAAA